MQLTDLDKVIECSRRYERIKTAINELENKISFQPITGIIYLKNSVDKENSGTFEQLYSLILNDLQRQRRLLEHELKRMSVSV